MKGLTPDNPKQLPEVVINAKPFGINPVEFEKVTGALNDIQLESIGAILKEAHLQGVRIKTQLAYIYATAFHESRIMPIKEWGSESYLKGKKYYPYFGRGYVQLTWDYNYKKEGERLGIDLLKNPDLALEIDIAANIIVNGMITGSFTGKKLSDYITANKTDFKNARRIINSMDKAAKIAEYASGFMKAII